MRNYSFGKISYCQRDGEKLIEEIETLSSNEIAWDINKKFSPPETTLQKLKGLFYTLLVYWSRHIKNKVSKFCTSRYEYIWLSRCFNLWQWTISLKAIKGTFLNFSLNLARLREPHWEPLFFRHLGIGRKCQLSQSAKPSIN